MQIGCRSEEDAVVVLEFYASAKFEVVVALRAPIPDPEVEDVLVARGVGEEALIVQVGTRALAADVEVVEACPRGIVVDVCAPMTDACGDGAFPLRHELPIGECPDFYLAEVSRRGDKGDAEGVRIPRDVGVEVGERCAPVARFLRARVADGEADMVALFLLHTNGDTIGACSCGRKLRSEDERTRVIDALDLLREFANVHCVA